MLNEALEMRTFIDFRVEFGRGVRVICCKPALSGERNSLLIGLYDPVVPEEMLSSNIFEGAHSDCDSWITRYSFSGTPGSLSRSADHEASVLLKKERANSLLEYAPNKLLVTTTHDQILLFHDWKFIRFYNDSNSPEYKCWWDSDKTACKITINTMAVLPGFDEVNFPFAAWARKNNISLVNIGENASYLDPLVEFDTPCRHPQQAFFFRKEDYGTSLHFTDHRRVPNGQTRMTWVQMRFTREFSKTLSEKGRFVSSLRDGLALI